MGIIGEGKDLLNLINKGVNRELYEKLSEYLDKVMSLQLERGELQESLRAAKSRVAELEELVRFKGKLTRVHHSLKVAGENRFICILHWEKENQAISLLDYGDFRWYCPACKAIYEKREGPEEPYSVS